MTPTLTPAATVESTVEPTLEQRIQVVVDIAANFASQVDVDARFPAEAVAALREQRLLNAGVPRVWGGEGLSVVGLAHIATRLGEVCSSTAMVFAMHQTQVLSIARHAGDSAELGALLERIVDQQLLLASATTEIGIGGDVRSSSCFVDRVDDRIHLVKNAPVISYAEHADLVLVTARRDADSAPGDQVLLVCERASTVLERTGTWDTLGLRGTCSFGYLLTADVDADRLLPHPYDRISSETMLPVSHTMWAAAWLGIANAAARIAREYVQAAARRSIGSLPAGATALVGLVSELEQLDLAVTAAAEKFDAMADDRAAFGRVAYAISINNLKVTASTAVADIVARALNITGISGYRNDGKHSVARLFRDAQGAALMVHNDRITANTAQLLLVSKGAR